MVSPFVWVDLVFGLTDGWWRFRDTDLRPAYPLVSRPRWESLLAEKGFADVISIAGPRQSDETEHVVFAARPPAGRAGSGGDRPARPNGAGPLVDFCGSRRRCRAVGRPAGAAENKWCWPFRGRAHRVDARRVELRVSDPDDVRQVLSGQGDNRPWRGIVHLWSLLAADSEQPTTASLDAAQRYGCYSVLHLVQALADRPQDRTAAVVAGHAWRNPPGLKDIPSRWHRARSAGWLAC